MRVCASAWWSRRIIVQYSSNLVKSYLTISIHNFYSLFFNAALWYKTKTNNKPTNKQKMAALHQKDAAFAFRLLYTATLECELCVGAASSPCVHPYTSISDLSVGVVLYLADSLHAYTGEVNLNTYLNIPNEWPYCRYEWLYKPVHKQTYLETCSWSQQPTNTHNHTLGWVWPKRGWRLERGEGR